VMPLIFSSGAGAAARVNMGVVIASGLAIGTMFTLFVVPAVYILLASNKTPPAGEKMPAPHVSLPEPAETQ